MDKQTVQLFDVDFVKHKLLTMQRERAYGHVMVKFEAGVMQTVGVNVNMKPPSAKEKSQKST